VNGARAGGREGKRPILARWEEVCGALPGTAALLLAFSLQTIFPLTPRHPGLLVLPPSVSFLLTESLSPVLAVDAERQDNFCANTAERRVCASERLISCGQVHFRKPELQ
jgi:hypothetical protein